MNTNRRLVYKNDSGATRVTVHVELDSKGDLLLTGHDVGKGPQEVAGDGDYEYTVRVPATAKDRVLLDLIAQAFGSPTSTSDFKDWLKAKGVPHTFETW